MRARRFMANPDLDRREIPAYGIIEVADYLRVPRKTVEYWVAVGKSPLVRAPSTSPPRFTFMNLLECHIYNELERIALQNHNVQAFEFTANQIGVSGMAWALNIALPAMQKVLRHRRRYFVATISKSGQVKVRWDWRCKGKR